MDWTKAKSILIMALIVTNLVLVFTYVFKDDIFESNDETVLGDTIKLLESKNIYIKTDIPKKQGRMPVLSVEYDTINQDVLEEQLINQKPILNSGLNETNIIEATTKFIDSCGFLTENVRFDNIEKKDDKIIVTYKNYINNIAIEDSYIICTIRNKKIEDIQRYWLNPVQLGKTKKEIIPAAAALIKFLSENNEDKKIFVEDISLVYWLDSTSFDTESPVSDTAFPAWKIIYNHGKIMHIMAYEQ